MRPTFTSRLTTAGVLLATVVLPASAAAQYQLPTVISSARADSLHDAALALTASHRWATPPGCTGAQRHSGERTIRSGSAA